MARSIDGSPVTGVIFTSNVNLTLSESRDEFLRVYICVFSASVLLLTDRVKQKMSESGDPGSDEIGDSELSMGRRYDLRLRISLRSCQNQDS